MGQTMLEEAQAKLDKTKGTLAALMGNLKFMDLVAKQRVALAEATLASKEAGDRYRYEWRQTLVRFGLVLEKDIDVPSIKWSPALIEALTKATDIPQHERDSFDEACYAIAKKIIAKDKKLRDAETYMKQLETKVRQLEPQHFTFSDTVTTPLTLLTQAERAVADAQSAFNHEQSKAEERLERIAKHDSDPDLKRLAKAKKKLAKIVSGEIAFEWPPRGVV